MTEDREQPKVAVATASPEGIDPEEERAVNEAVRLALGRIDGMDWGVAFSLAYSLLSHVIMQFEDTTGVRYDIEEAQRQFIERQELVRTKFPEEHNEPNP